MPGLVRLALALAALRSRGRRALRVHLSEVAAGLDTLEAVVNRALGHAVEAK